MKADETTSVFRVPANLVRDIKSVPVDKLARIEETRVPDERILEFPKVALGAAVYISYQQVDAAWKIMPALFKHEELYRAARFLKTSQDHFHVGSGQIAEVLDNPNSAAASGFEQNMLENALQNAFKAVEAVLGDPPKDDGKFFPKIRAIGLDPNKEVGYLNKMPLVKVIRNMNEARDKKAAHGSTTHRTITIGEMMEYQHCARFVVWVAIESKLGQRIYDRHGG